MTNLSPLLLHQGEMQEQPGPLSQKAKRMLESEASTGNRSVITPELVLIDFGAPRPSTLIPWIRLALSNAPLTLRNQ